MHFGGRNHQAFDGVGDVVALIQHVHWIEVGVRFGFDQFIKDKEQAIRINAASVQIVITVLAVIKVKAAEFAELCQAGDDHFDIHIRRMMPKIHEAFCLVAHLLRDQQVSAPVLDDS